MAWKHDSFPNSSGNPAKEAFRRRVREGNGLWQEYMSLTRSGEGKTAKRKARRTIAARKGGEKEKEEEGREEARERGEGERGDWRQMRGGTAAPDGLAAL